MATPEQTTANAENKPKRDLEALRIALLAVDGRLADNMDRSNQDVVFLEKEAILSFFKFRLPDLPSMTLIEDFSAIEAEIAEITPPNTTLKNKTAKLATEFVEKCQTIRADSSKTEIKKLEEQARLALQALKEIKKHHRWRLVFPLSAEARIKRKIAAYYEKLLIAATHKKLEPDFPAKKPKKGTDPSTEGLNTQKAALESAETALAKAKKPWVFWVNHPVTNLFTGPTELTRYREETRRKIEQTEKHIVKRKLLATKGKPTKNIKDIVFSFLPRPIRVWFFSSREKKRAQKNYQRAKTHFVRLERMAELENACQNPPSFKALYCILIQALLPRPEEKESPIKSEVLDTLNEIFGTQVAVKDKKIIELEPTCRETREKMHEQMKEEAASEEFDNLPIQYFHYPKTHAEVLREFTDGLIKRLPSSDKKQKLETFYKKIETGYINDETLKGQTKKLRELCEIHQTTKGAIGFFNRRFRSPKSLKDHQKLFTADGEARSKTRLPH